MHVLLTYTHAGGSPANVCDKECPSPTELLCRYFTPTLQQTHIYRERNREAEWNIRTDITYTDCDIHAMHVGQKRSRCGHCARCQRDNCGQCKYCKDMPQYGGSGKKRQCCIERKCLNISSNNAGKKETLVCTLHAQFCMEHLHHPLFTSLSHSNS